jgi:hypothetical protein
MTSKEDIIRMAREAGFEYSGKELTWESVICTEELERFAELVLADERKRLHDKFMEIHKSQQHSNNYWHFAARKIMEES